MVSILIPSNNGYHLIENLLFSFKQTVNYPKWQIIVIDNGSSDHTKEKLETSFPYVKIIQNQQNIGFPKSINLGIKQFPADFYFILNNDVILITQNWLSKLMKEMEKNPRIGMITGKLINIFKLQFRKARYNKFVKTYSKAEKEDSLLFKKHLDATAILVRDKTIRTVGLLNEDFSPGYYEDSDWCARMVKVGWLLAEKQNVIFLHFPRSTSKRLFSREFFTFYLLPRNRLRFFILHPSPKQYFNEIYMTLKAMLHIFFKDPIREKRKKLWYLFQAYYSDLKFILRRAGTKDDPKG